jgi:hypothetical protein
MADRSLICLFWRALDALDYSPTQKRLCMLDVVCRAGRGHDQPHAPFHDAPQDAGAPGAKVSVLPQVR